MTSWGRCDIPELILALGENGHADVAYEVVSPPERPGWVCMVKQGATTIWERWDSDDRVGSGMNSFNHSPYTFVSEWFYRVLAGLEVAGEELTVAPAVIKDLEWVEGQLDVPAGRLESRWERTDEGLALEVTIPWNTDATVRIPAENGGELFEKRDGRIWDGTAVDSLPDGIQSVRADGGDLVVAVSAGDYEFRLEPE